MAENGICGFKINVGSFSDGLHVVGVIIRTNFASEIDSSDIGGDGKCVFDGDRPEAGDWVLGWVLLNFSSLVADLDTKDGKKKKKRKLKILVRKQNLRPLEFFVLINKNYVHLFRWIDT